MTYYGLTQPPLLNFSDFEFYKIDFSRWWENFSFNPPSSLNFSDESSSIFPVKPPINYSFSEPLSTEIPSAPTASSEPQERTEKPVTSKSTDFGSATVSTASKYLGYNEGDKSYLKFTNGREEAWCADFVTSVVKEAAQETGTQLSESFGSPRVAKLEEWGRANGRYFSSNGATQSEIAQKVKPGDIVIFNHHTGIVKEVNGDVVTTIEGNTSDNNIESHAVAIKNRPIKGGNLPIQGFIQMA